MRDSLENLKAELLGTRGGAKEEGGAKTGGKDPKDPNVKGEVWMLSKPFRYNGVFVDKTAREQGALLM